MSEVPLTSDQGESGLGDPYYVFRTDLLRKLELVDEHLAELDRVVQQEDNTKLRNIKKSLKKSIKDASLTYSDLDTCVQLCSGLWSSSSSTLPSSSAGAPKLPPNELYERQCFSKACQDRLNQARDRVLAASSASPSPSKSTVMNGGHYGMLSSNGEANGISSNNSKNIMTTNRPNGSNHTRNNYQRESLLLHQHREQQEETLDELDAAVTRVGTMAEHIHEEIGHQGKMLDEMETDLVQAEEQLGVVMGKLSDFLGTKDQYQLCTIVGLFITAVILLFLVIYT
ncbi:hypothetical protein ACA910_019139 [Epithemia clementina (nom. ined.)]